MSDCRFGVSPVNYPDPDPDVKDVSVPLESLRPHRLIIRDPMCYILKKAK